MVRNSRISLGLTVEQLAERANLSPNYMGDIERGERDISLSTMMSLAKGLGVPVARLFGEIPDLSSRAMEMARLFMESPGNVQIPLLEILRAVRQKPA